MKEPLSVDLQKQVEKFIHEHGGSAAIARKMGKTTSTIHAYVYSPKKKKPSKPGLEILVEMAIALDCSLDEIVFGRKPQYEIPNSGNYPCQECKGKDMYIRLLEKQLKESHEELLKFAKERPASTPIEPQEAAPATRERERELHAARGRR